MVLSWISERWTSEGTSTSVCTHVFFCLFFYVIVLKQGAYCACRCGNKVDVHVGVDGAYKTSMIHTHTR